MPWLYISKILGVYVVPIFQYQCSGCNETTDLWHDSKICHDGKRTAIDPPINIQCPNCHSLANKIISNTSFRLKGGGWADDGHGKKK